MSSIGNVSRKKNITQEEQKALYKRTLAVVSIAQFFGGAGIAAGITVGALLAQQMLGTDAYSGIPAALFTLGSAGAALLVGRLSQNFGRRVGLTSGFVLGGLGAIGVVVAALLQNIFLLFASLFIYGAGSATNLQARYAGTDLANKKQRGTAVSIAMVSTTFGAVAGPTLVEVMGNFALSINLPALSGPFILSTIAFLSAGIIIFALLRPDPFIAAKMIESHKQQQTNGDSLSVESETNKRGVIVGGAIMVVTQIVMIAVMTMTPVHMKHHGFGLGEIGIVIGIHIGAMYLPSLVTGILVDKIGRTAMTFASGGTLLLSCIVAALSPGDSMTMLIIALALLGIGWNFGLISGTAMLVDATEPSTRAKTQGNLDVFVAISGAAGGGFSGLLVANSSFAALSFAGGILSLLLLPVVIWARK